MPHGTTAGYVLAGGCLGGIATALADSTADRTLITACMLDRAQGEEMERWAEVADAKPVRNIDTPDDRTRLRE
jgi:hypothetical protein